MTVAPFLDIEAAVRTWGNSRTSTLVGKGKPLALGFYPKRPRSPGRGCFANLRVVDGGNDLTAEGVTGSAQLEVSVYSATDKESSAAAAIATANEFTTITAARPVVGAVQLVMAADITWPELSEDSDDEPHHTFNVTIHATSA